MVHLCESPGGRCACPWHLDMRRKQHNTSMACAKRRLRGRHSSRMHFREDPPPTLASAMEDARQAGRAAAAALEEEGAVLDAAAAAAAAAGAAAVLEDPDEEQAGAAALHVPQQPRKCSRRRLSQG